VFSIIISKILIHGSLTGKFGVIGKARPCSITYFLDLLKISTKYGKRGKRKFKGFSKNLKFVKISHF